MDDSPIELAEVKAAWPEIEAIRFPAHDDDAAFALLGTLRDLFGKEKLSAEDALRRESIKQRASSAGLLTVSADVSDQFLEESAAELTVNFEKEADDPRALELVNKTNQFNLNGRRSTEASWREYLRRDETFLVRVSYQDKFGPLGKIAVVAGRCPIGSQVVMVDTWVMSCRAFSRRIEHRCLELLFHKFGAEKIVFDYEATARNGPLREFFTTMLDGPPQPGFGLMRDEFSRRSPRLFQRVTGAF